MNERRKSPRGVWDKVTTMTVTRRRYREWPLLAKELILQEVDAAMKDGRFGDVQHILDKYEITRTHIRQWRKQMEQE